MECWFKHDLELTGADMGKGFKSIGTFNGVSKSVKHLGIKKQYIDIINISNPVYGNFLEKKSIGSSTYMIKKIEKSIRGG